MLRVLRITAAISAGVTALVVAGGALPDEFLVPDLAAIALLAVGAAIPRADRALVGLLGGFSFGAAVFTVAFSASIADGELNPRVGVAALIALVAASLTARQLLLNPIEQAKPKERPGFRTSAS